MNILIIPSWYPREKESHGGSFFREQAIALQKSGHSVYVLNASFPGRCSWFDRKNFKLIKFSDEGVNVYSLTNPLFGLGRSKRVMNIIYKTKLNYLYRNLVKENITIDIIHAHSFLPAGYAATLLGEKYDIPVIITEHSSEIIHNSLSDYEKNCLRKSINTSTEFLCVSNFLKTKIKDIVHLAKEIKIIPNMLSPNFYHIQKRNNPSEFTFLSVGNLNKGKRFDLTIEAFTEAFENSEQVKLKIVGDGPLYKNLQTKISKLNMENNIEMLGAQSRINTSKIMQDCDVFVLPSAFETFGVVYIEALACGKPVIGAHNGGADYLIDNTNGILIDIDNKKQLVDAMRYMFKNRYNYQDKLISGECLKKYSSDAVVKMLNKLYKTVIEEGNKV
jgi:L-malate glycosyltransferase